VIFIPWFGQVILAYFHVVASQWTRVALNPFQVIQWSTWIPRFFLSLSFSRLRAISTTWSLSPLQWWSQKMYWSKGGESNTHKTQITAQSCTQVATWAQNTTHGVHNSNVSWMLGWLLHAPRGPFYSPKAARSRWMPTRKAKVAFCRVVRRTVTVDSPVRISFLFLRRWPLQRWASWHTGQSGAPCRPLARATRRPWIARPTVALAAVGSPGSPVHRRTVQWIIALPHQFFPRVCQAKLDFGCTKPSLLRFFSSLLFFVSST
jgi:hypothetical protein